MTSHLKIPNPILDKKELATLDDLNKKLAKITTPNEKISNAKNTVKKIGDSFPKPIKNIVLQTGGQFRMITGNLTQAAVFGQVMQTMNESYDYIQGQVSKFTIIDTKIVKHVSKKMNRDDLNSIQDFTLLRSYEISRVVDSIKIRNFSSGLLEGGATGVFGFWGLPANIAISNLLFFRVVQEVATYYGYDVKHDAAEMMIAGEVFAQSLNPTNKIANNELSENILKILTIAELQATKAATKKGWAEMIKQGGIPLALAQIRSLSHKSAAKALAKSGQKGIEFGVFKTVFEPIGKIITLKATGKSIPIVSAFVSAAIDSHQINNIFDYANIFYHKRFILEKEVRVQLLIEQQGSDEGGFHGSKD